jgi:hypothetical protein
MAFLALLAGLLLSGTAAYYSIIGLIAIFPGAVFAIALMGSSLELAKLVAASWLYRNWDIAPRFIKIYFIFAIIILMGITSLGTFGFLSKVHLETSIGMADNSIEISRIENQIVSEQRQLDNAQRSIETLDGMFSMNFNAAETNRIRNSQRQERQELNQLIKDSSARIADLNTQLVPLQRENIEVEAKIGPLKYIAELIYGDNAKDYFDDAVRFVIILIVLVFDPLAVLLLIAANVSFMHARKNNEEGPENKKVARKEKKKYNNKPTMKNGIYNFMMKDDFGIQTTDKAE